MEILTLSIATNIFCLVIAGLILMVLYHSRKEIINLIKHALLFSFWLFPVLMMPESLKLVYIVFAFGMTVYISSKSNKTNLA